MVEVSVIAVERLLRLHGGNAPLVRGAGRHRVAVGLRGLAVVLTGRRHAAVRLLCETATATLGLKVVPHLHAWVVHVALHRVGRCAAHVLWLHAGCKRTSGRHLTLSLLWC